MDTRARGFILAMALASVPASGCGDDADGTGGTGAEGGQPSTGGGGESVGPSCEDLGGQCLAIPTGFKGPVELHDDGIATCTNAAFEGGYDDGDFVAPNATCECSCITPGTPCTATATVNNEAGCAGAITSEFDVAAPGCHAAPVGAGWLSVDIEVVPSTCSSDEAPSILPAIQFDPKVDGCNVNLDLCDAGTCFPDSVKTYCIYSTTEAVCPAGFDDMHRVLQEADFDDTRDCSCNCDNATVTCDPAATLYKDEQCVDVTTQTGAGQCLSTAAGEAIASIQFDNPFDPQCDGTAETIDGGVTLGGPGVLVCCLSG